MIVFKKTHSYVLGPSIWMDGKYTKGGNAVSAYLDMQSEDKFKVTENIISQIRSISSKKNLKIHEIGSGPGAHLRYIHNIEPNYILSSNDVWPDAIKSIKEECDFIDIHEMDTKSFVKHCMDNDIHYDIIYSCAHIIHLTNDDINALSDLRNICNACIFLENVENLNNLFDDKFEVKKSDSNLPSGWSDCKHTFVTLFDKDKLAI